MQVKVSFRSAWLRFVLGGLIVALVGLSVLEPATVHGGVGRGTVTAPQTALVGEEGYRYRDGDRVVTFIRTGERQAGLTRLTLSTPKHTWTAWVGPRAVVQLKRGASDAASLTRLFARHRLRVVRPLSPALRLYLVESTEVRDEKSEDGASIAARLRNARELDVVPDLFLQKRRNAIAIPPNDPRYGGQWYLESLKIEEAWALSSGTREITIAIVDDGCDMKHPDLVTQFLGGFDAVDGDNDATYEPNKQGNEHGTACAGIAAAAGDNGIGIAGTCPSCTLSCVRLIGGKDNLVPLSADLDAFEYAFDTGAAIVSNSWGFVEPGPVAGPLAQSLARLASEGFGGRGALIVFAAGNENRAIGDDEIAALPSVMSVGAVNRFDEAAPFANHGPSLALSAPTGSLTTDISGPQGAGADDYTSLFGGTSAACPVVAGVAGLLRSAAPMATAKQVSEALIKSARKAPYATPGANGQDEIYGYGIVDPAAALRTLVPGIQPQEPAAPRDAGTPIAVTDAAAPPAGPTDAAIGASGTSVPDAGLSVADAAVSADSGVASTEKDDGGCAVRHGGSKNSWGTLSTVLLILAALSVRSRPRHP